MSIELFSDKGELGQFASNGGYSDLIAASQKDPVLKKFFDDANTEDTTKVAEALRTLHSSDDVEKTAKILAGLMEDQDLVYISNGTYDKDDEDVGKGNTDQPRDDHGRWMAGGSNDAERFVSAAKFARSRDGRAEMQAKFAALEKKQPKITPNGESAIKSYAGSTYKDINKGLRTGKIPGGPKWGMEGESNQSAIARITNDLKEAVNSSSIPPGTVLYRGGSFSNKLIQSLQPGTTFTDKGFTSTTLNPSKASDFAAGAFGTTTSMYGGDVSGSRVCIAIHAPDGGVGRAVSGSKEYEVILGNSSKFRVDSVQKVASPRQTFIHLTLKNK